MCLNTEPCAEPTMAGVWWRDDADWKQYDAAQAAAILRGIANGALKVDLGQVVSSKHSGGALYEIDLCAMKQTNLASGYTRDVKVVKAPAAAPVRVPGPSPGTYDDSSIKEELRTCKKSIRSLKNMVLKLEAEILAMKVEGLNSKVKASVARANHIVDGFIPASRRAPRGVSEGGVWERLDAATSFELENLSEDDY